MNKTFYIADLFLITISDLSIFFGSLTCFGVVTIFGMVATSGLVIISGLLITILGVLIMFLIAITG